MRVITINLNGIRAAARKGFFAWMSRQKADLICLQELRVKEEQMTAQMKAPGRYQGYFHLAERPGYSGVGIYVQREPDRVVQGLGWPDIDAEGRFLQVDYGNLSVVSLYLPSGSSSEERQQIKFGFMDRFLPWLKAKAKEDREYLICGDWNIAHRNIDLKNWRGNQKNSGFLPEERAWMDQVFGEAGWWDTHRRLQPEATGEAYTWWSNRGQAWANNTGWRIDYQVATPGIGALARQASVYKRKRFSDHAPLILDYDHDLSGGNGKPPRP